MEFIRRVCVRMCVYVYVCVLIEHSLLDTEVQKEAALKSELRSVFLLQAINSGTKLVLVRTLGSLCHVTHKSFNTGRQSLGQKDRQPGLSKAFWEVNSVC